MSVRPILIVDGFNLYIRSFMVNEAQNSLGEPIGGILGFLRSLKNIVTQFKPEKVFVVWEQGGPSPRRKHIFSEYKANRIKEKSFQELYKPNGKMQPDHESKLKQLVVLAQALKHLPVYQLFLKETEADDIIAWLVKGKFLTYDGPKIVVSNDKDFYQLLEYNNVKIYNPATKTLLDREHIIKEYGISPNNITLARAVVGDESDNIDGVPGVGLKTAAKRFAGLMDIETDHDVDWLLEQARNNLKASKKPPRCYADILENEEKIRRNWKLMFLSTDTLAASQIAKLNGLIDTTQLSYNYLEFIKTFACAHISITEEVDTTPSAFMFLKIS